MLLLITNSKKTDFISGKNINLFFLTDERQSKMSLNSPVRVNTTEIRLNLLCSICSGEKHIKWLKNYNRKYKLRKKP